MLNTLRIKNLALVDDLTLDLKPGLNAISGETGAGKSILIGALNLTLGERADRTLIRSGADSCTVEAVFDIGEIRSSIDPLLEESGIEPCDENQLLIKRVFTVSGSNKQFVNGSPTALSVLQNIGELLVDIHGPHDHQSLLRSSRQLSILDAFGNLQPQREKLGTLIDQRNVFESRKAELIVDEKTYAQQLDLLRFQVKEIESAKFQPDEETELEAEHSRASNSAQLLELTQRILGALGESDDALIDQAGAVGRDLHELTRIDPATTELAALHASALENWRELLNEVHRYSDKVEVDPARLAELDERLDLLQSMKRKYGNSIKAILQFGEEARQKLDALESRDAELGKLNNEIDRIDGELESAADALTKGRKKVSPKLSKSTTEQLRALGFAQSHLEVDLSSNGHITSTGHDTCEFLFAPNIGEPPRPLRAIASSGEMARVMLALKTVLAAQDEIPVLVFDEVDANVGGETATVVGKKMREIAARRQVICITHLPAVAAAADSHYVVRKLVKGERTVSEIKLLSKTERTEELTRMLGGQSEAARKHAKALLKEAGAGSNVTV